MLDPRIKGISLLPSKFAIPSNPLQASFSLLQEAEELRLQRKYSRAEEICESLLRRYPDYVAALHSLGLINLEKSNYQRAFDCLARAAMLNPESWTTLAALGAVFLKLGANEMAAQFLEQARRLKPQAPSILVILGELHDEEREYELARDAYRQALAHQPGFLAAELGLGWALSGLGEYAEAARIFETVVKRGVRLGEPVFALATLPAS